MQELFQLLPDAPFTKSRRKVVVLHGLGGIGKTQLAVEFSRQHQHRFSAIFWLDGSSKDSLKQSFIDALKRLPPDKLTANGLEALGNSVIDTDLAVGECHQWLSLASNHRWLLVFDNVDRDFHDNDDQQAYNVQSYFPPADHGSILITSRLASLYRLGSSVKVGTVAADEAKAILERYAERTIEGK